MFLHLYYFVAALVVLTLVVAVLSLQLPISVVQLPVRYTNGPGRLLKNTPTIWVFQHDFGTNDINIAIRTLKQFGIAANRPLVTVSSNPLVYNETAVQLISGTRTKVVHTKDRNVVSDVSNLMGKGHDFVCFFHRNHHTQNKRGIYYIRDNTNANVVLVKMRIADHRQLGTWSFHRLYTSTVHVEFSRFAAADHPDPQDFMERLYTQLYEV